MNPSSSSTSSHHQSGTDSISAKTHLQGDAAMTIPHSTRVEPSGKEVQIHVRDRSKNEPRLLHTRIESVSDFYRAARALYDIPADQDFELMVDGRVARGYSVDTLASTLEGVTVVHLFSPRSKKD